jgi:hypothetical protein
MFYQILASAGLSGTALSFVAASQKFNRDAKDAAAAGRRTGGGDAGLRT